MEEFNDHAELNPQSEQTSVSFAGAAVLHIPGDKGCSGAARKAVGSKCGFLPQ